VFVRNDDVVLNETSQVPEWKPCVFHGWSVCVRRIRYSASQKSPEKTSRLRA
jgi:hypothetical protein